MQAPDSELESAWLAHDYERVEALAKAHDDRAVGQVWAGLAQVATSRLAQAQATLKQAFDALRDRPNELTAAANRLVDVLAHDAIQSVGMAHFIVDVLKLEHSASLRLLAEDIALRERDAVRAATLLKRALATDATDAENHYLMARFLARIGKSPQAIKHLQAAIKYGARTLSARQLARTEPDFQVLQTDASFQAILEAAP